MFVSNGQIQRLARRNKSSTSCFSGKVCQDRLIRILLHPSMSLRSRRKHKAQGGAKRNPGFNIQIIDQPAKRATEALLLTEFCRPFHGLGFISGAYPGFRFASPWALCFRLLRRFIESKTHLAQRALDHRWGSATSLDCLECKLKGVLP